MLTLYDAARCPYCARARIALHEKHVEYEAIEIDLADRPAWIYEKNATGRVPVVEEDGWLLPESAVIMEYLEERYPEPALLAADPADRALAAARGGRGGRASRRGAAQARRRTGGATVARGCRVRPRRHRVRPVGPARP
jgi:glutathione S-transferase